MKQRAANTRPQLILAIDTSCDDTAAAVTCGTKVWSNIIASQTELHRPYGGVFPTVAKQAHRENIAPVVALALRRAGVTWADIAAIAVTQGPGLAPALEVGISFAKQLADEHNLPLYPINHIEGHLLSPLARPRSRSGASADKQYATQRDKAPAQTMQLSPTTFPTLGIIVSGGHTQFVLILEFGNYVILGETVDDAAGECLDKIGRMLNLGYPAGPVVEQFAKLGNPHAIKFPLPMTTRGDYNLSFSGLKTFARNLLEKERALTTQKTPSASTPCTLSKQEIYDWCASLQYAVFRHICHKLNKILEDAAAGKLASVVSGTDTTKDDDFARTMLVQPIVFSEVWLGGGVAANIMLRKMIRETLKIWYEKEVKKGSLGQSQAGRSNTRTVTNADSKQAVAVTARIPTGTSTQHELPLRLSKLLSPRSKRYCCDNAAMIGVVAGIHITDAKDAANEPEKNNQNQLKPNTHFERMPRMRL